MEREINSNGIELWTEDFGNPSEATVLLIMGMFTQGIFWSDALIEMIVASGRHVIRYDNRDVGRSSCIDFGTDPYTFHDLAVDATGILDAWDIEHAHVFGLSMGGMIVQQMMIDVPERLLSATIACSSPTAGSQTDIDDLPLTALTPIEAERAAWIEQQVAALGPEGGSMRSMFGVAWDRARDVTKAGNHLRAFHRSTPKDRCPLLAGCSTATTVIHGREDPIFPPAHAEALAAAIPNAKLAIFDMGHEYAAPCLPTIVNSFA